MMTEAPTLSQQSYRMASLAAPAQILPEQAERWLTQIFSARAAQGGVVRRAVAWVDREIGRARFIHEVGARNYHLICTGKQFIVVCHNGPVQVLF
ncbi:N-(5'-phosphoribosyl)anthranilate isomerase [Gemmobacter serpentinus]|uniref:N-(5'-phosphoribosyl)anthranilate isomerase n=1 Tax=Gemmobacter serpentinus TaxID=2652247 RepID=UPI001CF61C86|nr:N-(5'-phosphoribosyl)anthranilate isomerase [Gemmobacter serpentinus]